MLVELKARSEGPFSTDAQAHRVSSMTCYVRILGLTNLYACTYYVWGFIRHSVVLHDSFVGFMAFYT